MNSENNWGQSIYTRAGHKYSMILRVFGLLRRLGLPERLAPFGH